MIRKDSVRRSINIEANDPVHRICAVASRGSDSDVTTGFATMLDSIKSVKYKYKYNFSSVYNYCK